MVQPNVLLGLDLGASKVAAVIAVQDGENSIKVTGASLESPQGGIRQGEITDINATVAAISRAVEVAMRMAGQTRLDGIMVSVDGIQFQGVNLRDSVTISSADRVITPDDCERAMEQATNACKLAKEEAVLHKIPQIYHIKGQKEIKNPVNMIGDTLEAEVRIIVAPTPVLENIKRALELSSLQGAKLWYSPLASAKAVFSREDLDNGAVIVDIGDQLTHVGVFIRGALFHSAVIPIGGANFTKDLESLMRLGGINEAERIKRFCGTVMPDYVPEEDMIELKEEKQVSKRDIAEVLHARAKQLLEVVYGEIDRGGGVDEVHGGVNLLGGVHLVGGGALISGLPILAQNIFGGNRSRVILGKVSDLQGLKQFLSNPHYTNALGAVKLLGEEMGETITRPPRINGIREWIKNLF